MTTELPVWDTISEAWHKIYGAKASFWAAILLSCLIMFILSIFREVLESSPFPIKFSLTLILQVVGLLLQLGFVYMGITRAKDLNINYRMVFYAFQAEVAWRVIVVHILKSILFLAFIAAALLIYGFFKSLGFDEIAVTLPLIPLIIVVYFFVRLSLAMPYVLDKKTKPWESLKLSFKATQGNFWHLVGIYLLMALIGIMSAIPFGIGLIWTIPLASVVGGLIYTKLAGLTVSAAVQR